MVKGAILLTIMSTVLLAIQPLPVPAASSTATQVVSTDWAVAWVGTQPSSPTEGTAVKLLMTMTALSTTGVYPQSVAVQCTIDGASCGSGIVSYPGPTKLSFTTGTAWIAILGTHTLSWRIDPTNDPNPANNVMSISLTVVPPYFQSVSTTTTHPSTTSNPRETSIQIQTVTQQLTSSQAVSPPGVLNILQQNILLVIGTLALLVIILAAVTMRRSKRGS